MARPKFSLLDMAKGNLRSAELALKYGSDDVDVEIAAYQCSQCVEKAAKYLIKLQGDACANSHSTDVYLLDLKNENAKKLIEQVAVRVDSWNNQIRYEHSQLSSEKAVKEVLDVCYKLISLADKATPPISLKSEMKPVKPEEDNSTTTG